MASQVMKTSLTSLRRMFKKLLEIVRRALILKRGDTRSSREVQRSHSLTEESMDLPKRRAKISGSVKATKKNELSIKAFLIN